MENNETIEKMLSEHPLVLFSVYTSIQTGILRDLGRQIIEDLDGMMETANAINRVYGQFWLWTLGSFEVVRTMVKASSCFTPEVSGRLNAFKRKLVTIRAPFAKQEYPGKSVPIKSEASIYGIIETTKDLEFELEGTVYTIRGLINEFDKLISSIGRADILARHQAIYPDSTR